MNNKRRGDPGQEIWDRISKMTIEFSSSEFNKEKQIQQFQNAFKLMDKDKKDFEVTADEIDESNQDKHAELDVYPFPYDRSGSIFFFMGGVKYTVDTVDVEALYKTLSSISINGTWAPFFGTTRYGNEDQVVRIILTEKYKLIAHADDSPFALAFTEEDAGILSKNLETYFKKFLKDLFK